MEEHFAVSDCEKQWHRHWREQSTRYVKGMVFSFVLLFLGLFATPGFADHPEHELSSTTAGLSWTAPQATDIAGYKVFQGTESGVYADPFDVGNVTSFLVEGLGEGTHYFTVLAFDFSGNESIKSNEGSKTITLIDSTPPGPPVLTVDQQIAAAQGHLAQARAMLQVE